MDVKELRIGNLVLCHQYSHNKTIIKNVTGIDNKGIHVSYGNGTTVCKLYEPIPLTNEWLIKLGFKGIGHFTVMNSVTYDIGRDRVISVGCAGTPNEMVFLIENYSKRTPSQDICVLRNFDYDGITYVHHIQNIVYSITGKELEVVNG